VHAGDAPFGRVYSTSTQGATSACSSLSGDSFSAGANATASAFTGLSGVYGVSTVWLGDGQIYVPFTLLAETLLVITANASASATSAFDGPQAHTWASLFLKLTDGTGPGEREVGHRPRGVVRHDGHYARLDHRRALH
jgi:hypothetical protein